MRELLIENIRQLVQARPKASGFLRGEEMKALPVIENAWLLIKDGKIDSFGEMNNCPASGNIFDAGDRLVFPAWVDSHTHLVYAGSRESEFVDRIKGLSYEEIARRGGGILQSALRLRQTSEDELYNSAEERLREIIGFGTGAVEIKSGYGLDTESELKMLRVIRRLKQNFPIEIKSTFLGAHAIPPEFINEREKYIELICSDMIPKIAAEKLADYCDVFCDKGFFSISETERIIEAATKWGLKCRLHANELDYSGGVQLGVRQGVISVDHLEYCGEEEINSLLNSTTIPTLLPTTAFFLSLRQPPARHMIDAGLGISLASDYNPGSSPSGNMPFVLSLACINLKMTPEEAINAATVNAAHALELGDSHGSISPGFKANLFITNKIPTYSYLPYSFGSNHIYKVMVAGEFV